MNPVDIYISRPQDKNWGAKSLFGRRPQKAQRGSGEEVREGKKESQKNRFVNNRVTTSIKELKLSLPGSLLSNPISTPQSSRTQKAQRGVFYPQTAILIG